MGWGQGRDIGGKELIYERLGQLEREKVESRKIEKGKI